MELRPRTQLGAAPAAAATVWEGEDEDDKEESESEPRAASWSGSDSGSDDEPYGDKSSMSEGGRRDKLTGKKRAADVLKDDSPLDAGKEQLRTQRGTCYDERAESRRHLPTNQFGNLASSSCMRAGKKQKGNQHQQPIFFQQIDEHEQQREKRRQEDRVAPAGDDEQQILAVPAQGQIPAPAWEAPAGQVHVTEDCDVAEHDQGDHGGDAEAGVSNGVPRRASEAVRLATAFVEEQIKCFMAGNSELEVLESSLSKMVTFLVQMRASEARHAELEQQVKELTETLSRSKEELRGTQAAVLEARSAVAATSNLMLRGLATLRGGGGDNTALSGSHPVGVGAGTSTRLSVDAVEQQVQGGPGTGIGGGVKADPDVVACSSCEDNYVDMPLLPWDPLMACS